MTGPELTTEAWEHAQTLWDAALVLLLNVSRLSSTLTETGPMSATLGRE
jgi:hypothetical protein